MTIRKYPQPPYALELPPSFIYSIADTAVYVQRLGCTSRDNALVLIPIAPPKRPKFEPVKLLRRTTSPGGPRMSPRDLRALLPAPGRWLALQDNFRYY